MQLRTIIPGLCAAALVAGCATNPYGSPYPGDGYPPTGYPPVPYPPSDYPAPGPYPPGTYPLPPGPAAPGMQALAGSRWRIVAVNGRDTASQPEFTMSFTHDRLDARFGCNTVGAGYSFDGTTLDPAALVTTRMSCPDMSFETQGIAILSQPLRATWAGPRAVALSNAAGRLDLVRVN